VGVEGEARVWTAGSFRTKNNRFGGGRGPDKRGCEVGWNQRGKRKYNQSERGEEGRKKTASYLVRDVGGTTG